MRTLAEFIMSGRLRAALIVVLGLPFISEAAIALVTLRKGFSEGLLLVIVALVPGAILASIGQVGVDAAVNALSILLATLLPSLILRVTCSWAYAVWGLLGFIIVVVIATTTISPDLFDQLHERYQLFMERMSQEVKGFEVPETSRTLIVGILAFGVAVYSLLGLMLGRWWQAMLYNSGGFGDEFRQFRLGPIQASLSMVLVLGCLIRSEDLVFWAALFALPLVLVAVAVVHSVVKIRKLSRVWLLVFYGAIIFVKPMLLLAAIGFLDSWLNIRNRSSQTE